MTSVVCEARPSTAHCLSCCLSTSLSILTFLGTITGQFVLYRRIVEELLRLADDESGAADIDAVSTLPQTNTLPM
jgi:hypothetical protein